MNTSAIDIRSLVDRQHVYFKNGQTKDIGFRVQNLKRLQMSVAANEKAVLGALMADLGKSAYEGYLTEVGMVLEDIRITLRHLKRWAKPRRVKTPLVLFLASSFVYPEPRGVCLIVSPWNYPFVLAMTPLISSLAAGNCSVLKPSEHAPATAGVIADIIATNFDSDYMAVVQGDARAGRALLAERFDYIFFTGSPSVGRLVMQAAARNLTPLTLELGGKSPCIVDRTVNTAVSSRRIVSGKFINAGQTCIAPDYLLVHKSIKTDLMRQMAADIRKFYGENASESPDYPRIINRQHFERLTALLHNGNIYTGGETNAEDLYIAPTIVDGIGWDDPLMQDEIFGPILPVMAYDNLSDALSRIKNLPQPLALYFFSNNRKAYDRIVREVAFGGGCFNDTLVHFANLHLPFGGIGQSGFGSYHGKAGFDTFSHHKSIMRKSFRFDMPLRYPPYRNKLQFVRKVLR